MTAVIPKVIPKPLILLHKARRLCIMLGCIYILLVALGSTPFAQAQYVLFSEILFWLSLRCRVTPVSAFGLRLLFMHNLKLPLFSQYDMPERYDLARKNSFCP